MNNDNIQKVLDLIENSKEETIFCPADLQSQFQLTEVELKNEVILPLLIAGQLTPVYKFNTDLFFPNEWSPNLLGLSRKVKLKNGKEFDGTNPKNIKIAFKKRI